MKNFFKALAAFQQEAPQVLKDSKGYGYKYASLPQILKIITPYLSKHKLGFTQLLQGDSIKTIIFHTDSGENIESVVNIPQGVQLKGMNDYQVLGSAITYLRRYALESALGLVSTEDSDAAGEQVTTPKKVQQTAPKKAKKKISSAELKKLCDWVLVDPLERYGRALAEYALTKPQQEVLSTVVKEAQKETVNDITNEQQENIPF